MTLLFDDFVLEDVARVVSEEENEIVVGKALRESVTNKTIPNIISQEEAQSMFRCDGLDGDETNGYFVCVLERQRQSHRPYPSTILN